MRTTILTTAALGLAVLLSGTARAERYTLADGSEVVGAEVAREADLIHVMTADGPRVLLRLEIVASDPQHPISPGLRQAGDKARERYLKSAYKEAKKLVKAWQKAETPARPGIEKRLGELPGIVIREALEDELKDHDAGVRAMAVRVLESTKSQEAITPLLRAVLTGRYRDTIAAAHQAALRLDKTRTREIYEEVSIMQTKPERRIRALQMVAALGLPQSVPRLIYALEYVGMEVSVQVGTLTDLRQIPINLGTIQNAALNVPIELPEMQLFSVSTSTTVPTLRRVAAAAGNALSALTEEDFGTDGKRWAAWYEQEGREQLNLDLEGKLIERD